MVVESESPVYSRTVQQPAASRLQSCTRHSRRRTLFGVTRRSTAATWCCMPPPRRGPNRDYSTPYWRARVGPKPEGGDALKAWKKECRRQTQVLSRAGLLLVPLPLSPTPSLPVSVAAHCVRCSSVHLGRGGAGSAGSAGSAGTTGTTGTAGTAGTAAGHARIADLVVRATTPHHHSPDAGRVRGAGGGGASLTGRDAVPQARGRRGSCFF